VSPLRKGVGPTPVGVLELKKLKKYKCETHRPVGATGREETAGVGARHRSAGMTEDGQRSEPWGKTGELLGTLQCGGTPFILCLSYFVRTALDIFS